MLLLPILLLTVTVLPVFVMVLSESLVFMSSSLLVFIPSTFPSPLVVIIGLLLFVVVVVTVVFGSERWMYLLQYDYS